MNQQGSVEIVDGNGWRKQFSLEKNLIYIGSAAGNDIVLDRSRGGGVAQRHLQLIALPGEELRYRAVNLGTADILLGQDGSQVLAPRSTAEIGHAERIKLGDFSFVFHLSGQAVPVAPAALAGLEPPAAESHLVVPPPGAAAIVPPAAFDQAEVSDVIGLQLSLPSGALVPDRPLEGVVTVRNLGKEPGVQFKLAVQGLDPDYYEIGPGPILFPNVEKGVFLRLDHSRKAEPPAGRHQIAIRASAPEAYPEESAVVTQEIEIAPYHKHTVNLIPVG